MHISDRQTLNQSSEQKIYYFCVDLTHECRPERVGEPPDPTGREPLG